MDGYLRSRRITTLFTIVVQVVATAAGKAVSQTFAIALPANPENRGQDSRHSHALRFINRKE